MKVWIFKTEWHHGGGGDIIKVFDSKEKGEKWKKRVEELGVSYSKLMDDYDPDNSSNHTAKMEALDKEAEMEYNDCNYQGGILEMEVE